MPAKNVPMFSTVVCYVQGSAIVQALACLLAIKCASAHPSALAKQVSAIPDSASKWHLAQQLLQLNQS